MASVGFTHELGSVIATPGSVEKGTLDVLIEVTAPGGHSNVKPPYTAFVVLSSRRLHSFDHSHSPHRASVSSPRFTV